MHTRSASVHAATFYLVVSVLNESEIITTDEELKESRDTHDMKIDGFSTRSIIDPLSKRCSHAMHTKSSRTNLTY